MSYILDALKKSEKERTRKHTPSVAALQNTPLGVPAISLKSIITLVLAIALANAAVIYIFFPYSQEQILTTTPTSEKMTTNSIIRDESLGYSLEDHELSKNFAPGKIATDVAESALPALLPSLDVTAHIYADAPDLRMVKINGMNRHQGDFLAENHQLVEITHRGIILEYYGQRYNLNVLEDWQID